MEFLYRFYENQLFIYKVGLVLSQSFRKYIINLGDLSRVYLRRENSFL